MGRLASYDTALLGKTIPNGCRLHFDCFSCPLPDCFFAGQPVEWKAKQRGQRDAQIRRLAQQGLTYAQIALTLGTSERTVSRIIGGK